MKPAAVLLGVAIVITVAGCARTPGGDRLPGRLVSVDDTGGGEHGIGRGWMLAVPADRAADLWAAGGLPEAPAALLDVRVELAEPEIDELGGVIAEITDAGRFRLDAPEGPGVICWLLSAEADDVMFSRGCAEVDVPSDGTLRATWGEAGFFVEVE